MPVNKKTIPKTIPCLHKRPEPFLQGEAVESTPIIFNNQPMVVYFDRPGHKPFGSGWFVYHLLTKEKLGTAEWNYGLGSAMAKGDRVYLFGSSQWDQPNHIVMSYFDTKFQMGPIQKIWDSRPDQSIYNTTVCPNAAGDGYIMAYEVREPNTVPFSIRFLQSTDLLAWKPIGDIFHPEIYAACPTIRYYNGYYYILYLRSFKKYYVMSIARTHDFVHFEDFTQSPKHLGNYQVLSSVDTPHEGINNSDVDLVEYEGITILMYADGDQRTWGKLRTAVYLGSMGQFFEEFWPK